MSRGRTTSSSLLALVLAALTLGSPGCAALIDGGFRELSDHGSDARYPHQSYGEHVLDSLLEGDDDDCDRDRRDRRSHRTIIVVDREG